MLRTGTIVTVQHATHWYHSQSPTCYALVPLSQSNMQALVFVTVQHATHWYDCSKPTCYSLVP
ncbi:hypothetical protein DPMN_038877 [Dreissena polymorpha]|uniref:Uncharacterized protein n=1 Tax=Dreissena polymorpha TaxID=45954 RepID=A0A9D4MHV0_DREPO|nr:hypothetical protein DPMN_038877 [Dreissena polymorpha]